MKKTEKQAYRILVVDDEPTVCKAVAMMLHYFGHKVETADGGLTGLARFEAGEFDLVITDYMMPDMKGDKMVMLMKQRRPEQRILMATAFAEDFLTHGKPSGGVDFVITKPFSLTELNDAIDRVMAGVSGIK